MTYTPFIHKIPSINTDNIYTDNTIITSSRINMPLISLGFHSFIHRTKSAMDIILKLETKKDFYNIVNQFEHIINDYKDDINSYSYISLPHSKDEPPILSQAFYKMWEILLMFDIANENIVNTMIFTEGSGSFIQAIIKFREKFYNISKDKIYYTTLPDKNENVLSIKMDKALIDYYPNLLFPINITKNKTINQIDLVIADGSIEGIDENYQEQESYVLIFTEILNALKIQAKNGNFVLRIYETFTLVTIKMIYLLTLYYDEVIIYKPYFSRNTSSEKYVICKKFKYDQVKDKKFLNNKLDKLEKTLEYMNTTRFIVDIFPQFIPETNYLDVFKYINILVANTQQIIINKLVQYIKSNNYFGDDYHMYRENQILATKWWISTYFVESKVDFTKLVKDTIYYNESELNLFVKTLINF